MGTGYEDTFRGGMSKDFESKRITRSAEELQIGKRAQQKGEVRVSKHVETSHVTQSVPVQREESTSSADRLSAWSVPNAKCTTMKSWCR